MEITEDLLINPHKNLAQVSFLSQKDITQDIFYFSEQNLLSTQNIKAREYYLTIIAKRFSLMSYKNFEITKTDFYISNFITKDSLLKNSNFNTKICKENIIKIQIILTHYLYNTQIDDFFSLNSDEYLFSWDIDDILNYLEAFNVSMNLPFCFFYRDLLAFENLLYKTGAEYNIFNFLIQYYADFPDTRTIMIVANALKWMNRKIVIENKSLPYIKIALLTQKSPAPIATYFTNIMDRLIDKPENTFSLFKARNQIINNVLNVNFFQIILDYLKITNDYQLASFIYTKITRDYITLYKEINDLQGFIVMLIDLIEYASCNMNFGIYGITYLFTRKKETSTLFTQKKEDSNELKTYSMIIKTKIDEIISNFIDPFTMIRKIYGYCSLVFRALPSFVSLIFTPFPFQEGIIVQCSLCAIKDCIKFLDSTGSVNFLAHYISIFDENPSLFCGNNIFNYLECLKEVLYNSTDASLLAQLENIYKPLMDKIYNVRIPEEELALNILSDIFDHQNFTCMIYLSDKEFFINAINKLIECQQPPFIEAAKHIINSFLSLRNDENDISTIYNNITTILKSQPINEDNKLEAAQILSLLSVNFINSNHDAQSIFENLMSLKQDELCASKYYVQTVIQLCGFDSYDKISQFFLTKPSPDMVMLLVKLPSNKIDPKDEKSLKNAVSFAEIIINSLHSYTEKEFLTAKHTSLANASIDYIMPIFEYLGEENAKHFTALISEIIKNFSLKPDKLRIFLALFQSEKAEEFQDIAWDVFDKIKDTFFKAKNDCDLCDFDEQALEILKFQHYMFNRDNDLANSIFAEINPKYRDYYQFLHFMSSNYKKPFSEPFFKDYVAMLKARSRSSTSLNYI